MLTTNICYLYNVQRGSSSVTRHFHSEPAQELPKQPHPTHLLHWEAMTMSMVSTPIPMMLMTACPASVLARLKMHKDCRLGALLWHKHRTVSPEHLWHFATLYLENYHKETSFLYPHWSFLYYSPLYFQSTLNRKVDGSLSQEIYVSFLFLPQVLETNVMCSVPNLLPPFLYSVMQQSWKHYTVMPAPSQSFELKNWNKMTVIPAKIQAGAGVRPLTCLTCCEDPFQGISSG